MRFHFLEPNMDCWTWNCLSAEVDYLNIKTQLTVIMGCIISVVINLCKLQSSNSKVHCRWAWPMSSFRWYPNHSYKKLPVEPVMWVSLD